MTTIVRRYHFCAGHRLFGHEGKCAGVHGHNYIVEFHAVGQDLDAVGRVIDFGVLKEKLGGWIDEHWDHGFICYSGDEMVREALSSIAGQKLFLIDVNPTAENLASYLLEVVGPMQLEGTGVKLARVVLWETSNCRTEVVADDHT